MSDDLPADEDAAQDALAASEERYRRLFESAKDGILILDADSGRIVDVNPFLTELTGFPREDFLDKHLWEIGSFRDVASSKESFAELQERDYVRYDDLPLMARDGRKIDVEFVSNVYRSGNQTVIQCNIRDISARKRADLERDRLSAAINQVGEAVLMTDVQAKIVYVNPSFEAVTGYPSADVIGRSPRILKSGAHDAGFYETLWSTILSGETWRGRIVNRAQRGSLYTADATISPVRDTAGRVTGYVAVQRDITKDLVREAQLQQAQKMESIGRLAGGVAHDFNNILTVILGYTGLMLQKMDDDDPNRPMLEAVENAGRSAAVLTGQLLAFSRRQVLQPTSFDVNSVVVRLAPMLRRILGEDIDLVHELSPDAGLARADPGQLEQVLMNLVANARDAMPEGGRLTIRTASVDAEEARAAGGLALNPGRYVLLSVGDTGVGMDAATRARVFEPFFTTKVLGKGTGLGLSIVDGIVRQSGGHISIHGEPGEGTTFKVFLPRGLPTAEAPPAKRPVATTRTVGTETILLVEDEAPLREVARRILTEGGYKVLAAGSGDEALRMEAEHAGEIHLLVSDVVMPKMGGRNLAQELSRRRPGLKVLYMSGYSDDAIGRHGVLDPGTHFIEKPFTSPDLTAKVRQVLDGA